jgi:cysteine desulfuration protein SufE
MAEYPRKLQELLEDFESIVDRTERVEMLIDFADRFEGVPPRIATRPFPEEHRVPHCESEAYVWAEELPDGTLKYYFAVENPQGLSAKALAVILDETLSGAPLEQVVQVPEDIVYRIFGRELSMGKGLGLTGILGMAKGFAIRHLQQRGRRPLLAE